MLKKLSAIAVAAMLVASPSAMGAVGLLESFEGFGVGSSLNGAGIIVNTGNGITDGVQALRLDNSTGGYDKLGHIILNNYFGPGSTINGFQADWYFEGAPGSSGSYNGLSFGMYNQATSQFFQLSNTIGEYIDQTPAGTGQYSVTYILTATEKANIESAINLGQPLELGMYSNKDAGVAGNYVIDNIRYDGNIVPEPASLALFGLGGLAMLRRR